MSLEGGMEKEQEEATEINEVSLSGHRATKVKPVIAGHSSSPPQCQALLSGSLALLDAPFPEASWMLLFRL